MPFRPRRAKDPGNTETVEELRRLLEAQGTAELAAAHLLATSVRLAPTLDDRVVAAEHLGEELSHFEAAAVLYEAIGGGDLHDAVRGRAARLPEPSSFVEAQIARTVVCSAAATLLRALLPRVPEEHMKPIEVALADEEEHAAVAEAGLIELLPVKDEDTHLARWVDLAADLLDGVPDDELMRRAFHDHVARLVTQSLLP